MCTHKEEMALGISYGKNKQINDIVLQEKNCFKMAENRDRVLQLVSDHYRRSSSENYIKASS